MEWERPGLDDATGTLQRRPGGIIWSIRQVGRSAQSDGDGSLKGEKQQVDKVQKEVVKMKNFGRE